MRTFFIRYFSYSTVGTLGSLVNITVFFLFSDVLRIDYRISSLGAIAIRILFNFYLNCLWTWKELRGAEMNRLVRAFVKFGASSLLLSLLVNWTVMLTLTEFTGLNHNLSNLAGILVGNIGSVLNFTFCNYVAMKKRRVPAAGETERPKAVNE